MTSDEHPKDAPGTGGLSLEPPPEGPDETLAIGFAPDLTDDAPSFGAALALEQPPEPPAAGPSAPSRAAASSARKYPLAEAVLDRLLATPEQTEPRGDEPDLTTSDPADAVPVPEDIPAPPPAEEPEPPAPFVVGAPIMRPPADIVTEPPPRAPEEVAGQTQGHLDDMVEVVLVGKPEDGKSEIHLLFKEDVLQGLYLVLQRRSDGLFAQFTVGDDTSRRAVLGRVDELVARLRDRGMAIAGYDVAVKAPDA